LGGGSIILDSLTLRVRAGWFTETETVNLGQGGALAGPSYRRWRPKGKLCSQRASRPAGQQASGRRARRAAGSGTTLVPGPVRDHGKLTVRGPQDPDAGAERLAEQVLAQDFGR
jgi:hypothetical protein